MTSPAWTLYSLNMNYFLNECHVISTVLQLLNSFRFLRLKKKKKEKEAQNACFFLFFPFFFVQKKLSVALFLFYCIYVDTLW